MLHWIPYRHSPLLTIFLTLLLFSSRTLADEQAAGFDCHVTVSGAAFDLTKLAGEHTLNETRDSPPTKMIDSLRFNLCADLKPLEGVADDDQVRGQQYLGHLTTNSTASLQCPKGTRACLTRVNKKTGEPDRVVSVIPLVNAASEHTDTADVSGRSSLPRSCVRVCIKNEFIEYRFKICLPFIPRSSLSTSFQFHTSHPVDEHHHPL